ncbi:MAG TPA: hypothetical protein VIM59_13030 [Cellvibrio sp.]
MALHRYGFFVCFVFFACLGGQAFAAEDFGAMYCGNDCSSLEYISFKIDDRERFDKDASKNAKLLETITTMKLSSDPLGKYVGVKVEKVELAQTKNTVFGNIVNIEIALRSDPCKKATFTVEAKMVAPHRIRTKHYVCSIDMSSYCISNSFKDVAQNMVIEYLFVPKYINYPN